MRRQNSFSFFIVIICIMAIALGCVGSKKLWRSYEKKPFDAERWKKADAIERGAMSRSLVGVGPILENVGKNKTEIIQTLGNPDKTREDKIGEKNATVLIYEIDLGEPEFMYGLQIYLDDEKLLFANIGATREKESLLEKIKKKLPKNES